MVTAIEEPAASARQGSRAGLDEILRLEAITKRFPGVNALVDVDFDLRAGEVHVLFGENGAGKSTLISIISGATPATMGKMYLEGKEVQVASVAEARRQGINAVYQEFSLVPHLTVEENIFLGEEITRGPFLDKSAVCERSARILDELEFPIDPKRRVAFLSRAEQQMVEIAKAFRKQPKVLILDEPTASLTERESERLFALIEQIRNQGVGVIYITHRMAEIHHIADRITVLRDGRYIDTVRVSDCDDESLIELMTGRVISQVFPVIEHRPGEVLLEVENLSIAETEVRDVSINVRAGEIVGIAGLVGSGKSDVARACFGVGRPLAGRVAFDGRETTGASVTKMLDLGMCYLPPDRREEGLLMVRGARENISLAALGERDFSTAGVLKRGREREVAHELASRVDLRPLDLERSVEFFSGGNQQKIMIAKALARDVKLFIFDEPTVGVDVGTRVAIYELIRELCEGGAGVLLVSSELPEILNLANRSYVMYRGVVTADLRGDELTEERVLSHFFERETA